MDSKYAALGIKSPARRGPESSNSKNIPPAKKFHLDKSASNKIPLREQRRALPIFPARKRLLDEVQKYPTVIMIGETGSGKTTQIPQYIHEMRLEENGMIAVTQPRRVAAVTVSKRVADEMNTELGELVGYTVRFEDVTSRSTKVKYLTDGMLLREAMGDRVLSSYNVIILDEAHERTINTDVLFGIVKEAQAIRKKRALVPLKIIIMSATMDVDHFSSYFGDVPVLYLEGRQHQVHVYHALESQEDYVFSCLVTIFQIHREAPANQDILVFLTGQEEIDSMAKSIKDIAKDLQGKYPQIKVCILYASLPSHVQMVVFRPTPPGFRKIILSTNIAETSVTISGVRYIVDSGMVKARTHHPGTGFDMLKVQRISQAQAWQRTGRAGREAAGHCYRAFTKQEFSAMSKNTIPEIQRCNLSTVILQLLAIGIDIQSFDFMDKPPREAIVGALQQLKLLGAIESIEQPKLTEQGKQMAQFPLDPRFSKIILASKDYECTEEILSIVAVLSGESIFVNPSNKQEEADAARWKFVSSAGDHMTLLSIFKMFSGIKSKEMWCHENFLNVRNLSYASEVRSQLTDLCHRMELPIKSCGENLDQVRKCLITGLFMNVAQLQREGQYLCIGSRQSVVIHPSSVLSGTRPEYVLFTEVVHTGRCFLRQLSLVDPDWLMDIAPEYMRQHRLNRDIR